MKAFKVFFAAVLFSAIASASYLEVGAKPNFGPTRQACTVTANSGATNVTFTNVFCWQVGDSLRIEGQAKFSGAGGVGAVFRIHLPTGYTIATAKLPSGITTSGGEASSTGFCTTWDDASTSYRVVCPIFYDTGGVYNEVGFNLQGSGTMLDSDFAINDSLNFKIEVPVW